MHRPASRSALAAAAWAIVFSVPSFYWALGGSYGVNTIAADPREALGGAADPAILALVGFLKLGLAGFALSFLVPSCEWVRRTLRVAGGILSLALGIYGLASLVDHLLMLGGAKPVPGAIGDEAVAWHSFLWDPYWLLGAVLFGLAVRNRSGLCRSVRR